MVVYVTREICLLGLGGIYRSAAPALGMTAANAKPRERIPASQLQDANQREVVITTRRGRVHIGRLVLVREAVELQQIVHGIPCRHRYGFDDVVACYIYGTDDDTFDDDSTRPLKPRSNDPYLGTKP